MSDFLKFLLPFCDAVTILCEFCDAVKCDLQNYDQMIKTEVGSWSLEPLLLV